MGAFQIAFIVINIAIPYWIWSGDDDVTAETKIEWQAWTNNMKRLVEATGKSTCRSSEMVDKIRGLCHQSEARFSAHESVVFEQVIGNALFSCAVHKDYLLVRVFPYTDSDPSEKSTCLITDPHQRIKIEPEFLFTHKGFVNSISFNSPNGVRESIPIRNCRQKLKKVKGLSARNLGEFEESLGQLPGDPNDFHTANRLCLSYDAAPGWKEPRAKFLN